jgi:hypothetical protein
VSGQSEDLDPDLKDFAEELAALRNLYRESHVTIEEPWAWTERFEQPCDWKDGWVRMKLDFYVHGPDLTRALVVDLKSGKKSGNEIKHTEQGELYAIGAYLRSNRTLKEVRTEFWYVDQNDSMDTTYTEDRILFALPRWIERGLKVTSGEYPARPNIFSCKFCPFRRTEDGGSGACEFAAKIVKVPRKKSNPLLFDFGNKP